MKNTLFILGAGASKPYGYPTGAELRIMLCNGFHQNIYSFPSRDNPVVNEAVVRQRVAKAQQFADTFESSSIQSIDAFLNINPSYEQIGKTGIVWAILQSERNSRFNESSQEPAEDWYSYFFNRILPSPSDSDPLTYLKNTPVRIITFNYDRSLDHYLYSSLLHAYTDINLRNKFVAGEEKIRDFLFLNIRHVYGVVASPFHDPQNEDQLPYGERPRNTLDPFIKNIKLIGDRLTAEKQDIAKIFEWAEAIFFLGFGFAPENLEAIDFFANRKNDHLIFGTTMGMLDEEATSLRNRLRSPGYPNEVILENTTCKILLRKYLR